MRVLLSLGSNLGASSAHLDVAEERLRDLAEAGSYASSSRYETQAVGGPAGQKQFLNAAAVLETQSDAAGLLGALQGLEEAMGRDRPERWGARTLDIDLLLCDGQVIREPNLRVPHPRMTFRPFVLEPAVELAADWRHPECGETLGDLWGTLRGGVDELLVIGDDDGALRSWVTAARGEDLRVRGESRPSGHGGARQPRLTIDASADGVAAATPGPRLVLADCPPEHWRDEVLAAVECVWPSSR